MTFRQNFGVLNIVTVLAAGPQRCGKRIDVAVGALAAGLRAIVSRQAFGNGVEIGPVIGMGIALSFVKVQRGGSVSNRKRRVPVPVV